MPADHGTQGPCNTKLRDLRAFCTGGSCARQSWLHNTRRTSGLIVDDDRVITKLVALNESPVRVASNQLAVTDHQAHVLLIDSDRDIAEIVYAVLTAVGFTVSMRSMSSTMLSVRRSASSRMRKQAGSPRSARGR